MKIFLPICFLISALVLSACGFGVANNVPQSSSGVSKATVKIKPTFQFEGKPVTAEQFNIMTRVSRANKAGSVKHLYVISAYSGDVLIYSTVKGKVTSSGKRLTPRTINGVWRGQSRPTNGWGVEVDIAGTTMYTSELLGDDGSYGSSNAYLYWVDARGAGHEQYVTGGTFVHVSDVPMNFPKIILNLETTAAESK
jgi:hypothetical protein